MTELRKLKEMQNHIGYVNQELNKFIEDVNGKLRRIEAKITLQLPLTREEKQYYYFLTGKKI